MRGDVVSSIQIVVDRIPFVGSFKEHVHSAGPCQLHGNQLSIASMSITGQEDGPSAESFNDLANELGNQLGATVRNVDYAARWSDHEFLVVLPETEIEGARQFMEKVESLVNKFKEEHSDARLKVVTEVTGWESGDDMASLLSKVGL